jgi:acyl-CoA-binding protein
MTQFLCPDVQLRLYACYKQATFVLYKPRQTLTYHLRMLLKRMLTQISHLTTDEAKEQYIEIINSLLKNNTKMRKASILIMSLLPSLAL